MGGALNSRMVHEHDAVHPYNAILVDNFEHGGKLVGTGENVAMLCEMTWTNTHFGNVIFYTYFLAVGFSQSKCFFARAILGTCQSKELLDKKI